VPEGETPHAITVIAYDYNVDLVKPGDRVEVVGIYRVQQQKIMKRTS
jgi:DNA replication licensing factor MCM4